MDDHHVTYQGMGAGNRWRLGTCRSELMQYRVFSLRRLDIAVIRKIQVDKIPGIYNTEQRIVLNDR